MKLSGFFHLKLIGKNTMFEKLTAILNFKICFQIIKFQYFTLNLCLPIYIHSGNWCDYSTRI